MLESLFLRSVTIFLFLWMALVAKIDAATEPLDYPIAHDIYMLLEPGEAIVDIHKIGGGFANHLWLIETSNNKYVLRSPREKEAPAAFMHSLEISQKSFECGLAPRVVGVNLDKQQVLMDYAANTTWPVYHENALPYRETMKALRGFHICVSTGDPSDRIGIPFASIFRDGYRLFSNALLPVHFSVAWQRCMRIFDCLNKSSAYDPVICHGDFHTGNVLLKQEEGLWCPLLIDFDTAAWGHPLFDVAKFTIALDPGSRLELLTAYLGREPGVLDKAHFELLDLSLLMVIAVVRYNYVLDRDIFSEDYLSKEEMETLLDNPEEQPSFKSISFGSQSAKMRQLGALYALSEFLRRTEGEAFENTLQAAFSDAAY